MCMDAFGVGGECWWAAGTEEQLTCRQFHGNLEFSRSDVIKKSKETGAGKRLHQRAEQPMWFGTVVACGGWLPRLLGSAAGTQLCLSRPSRASAGWREQLCWQPEMGLSWILSSLPSSSWIDVSKHCLTAGLHRDWQKCKCSYSAILSFICRGSTGNPVWTLSCPHSGAGANPAFPHWLEGDSSGSRGLQCCHQ